MLRYIWKIDTRDYMFWNEETKEESMGHYGDAWGEPSSPLAVCSNEESEQLRKFCATVKPINISPSFEPLVGPSVVDNKSFSDGGQNAPVYMEMRWETAAINSNPDPERDKVMASYWAEGKQVYSGPGCQNVVTDVMQPRFKPSADFCKWVNGELKALKEKGLGLVVDESQRGHASPTKNDN